MSVKKISGRLKRKNVFEILPYVAQKYPILDPVEILGEKGIKKYKKMTKDGLLDFVNISDNVKNIIYSEDEMTFKCLYCGATIQNTGVNFVHILNILQ